MKKLLLAGLTTGVLALGMGGATAPANAFIYFGFGGPVYPHHYWGGYGWHQRCGWVWHHHRKHRVCW